MINRDWYCVFDPRVKFGPVIRGQIIGKSTVLKFSSPHLKNYVQYGNETFTNVFFINFWAEWRVVLVSWLNTYLLCRYSIQEGKNATLAGKITRGQSDWKSLIDIWNGSEAFKTGLCEKHTTFLVSGPQEPPSPNTNFPLCVSIGRPRSVTSDDLRKAKMQCQRS